jgi:hypothetical protein
MDIGSKRDNLISLTASASNLNGFISLQNKTSSILFLSGRLLSFLFSWLILLDSWHLPQQCICGLFLFTHRFSEMYFLFAKKSTMIKPLLKVSVMRLTSKISITVFLSISKSKDRLSHIGRTPTKVIFVRREADIAVT